MVRNGVRLDPAQPLFFYYLTTYMGKPGEGEPLEAIAEQLGLA